MIKGYIRVSTVQQNLDRQEDCMVTEKVEKVYREKASGKNRERPELERMLSELEEGDMIVVMSLDRLGRSVGDLNNIWTEILNKGATLKSVKEGIDFSTATGRLYANMLASIAQFEREIMLERQAEGYAAARARGRKIGRKKKPKEYNERFEWYMEKYMKGESTREEVCKTLGIKARSTFYKVYSEWQEFRANGEEGVVKVDGEYYQRVKYGGAVPCPECGVEPGKFHVVGCPNENCPRCGYVLPDCGCVDSALKLKKKM